MTARNKNIPALRFKEFRDNWNRKELGDICTFYSGGTPSSTNKKFYSGTIPFIGSGNIYDSQVSSFITEEALNSSSAKMVKEGDLLYALYGANSGEVAISKISGAINQAILCIRSNEEYIQFIYALLLFNKDKIVSKYLQGGQGNLSANIIKRLRYHFPSLPEQQKIASFLSAIDEKMRQLTRRKELLEQYKKGVMQQLFTCKLRFKQADGKAYPKWEEKRLGDVAKLQSGFAFKSQFFKQVGIPVIRISNISNDHNNIELSNVVYYDKIPNPDNFTIKNGDLILAMSGATTGKSSIYNLPYTAYLNQRVGLFKSKTKSLAYEYLIQFVFSEEFQKQLETVLVAGAQPNVSSSDIESFKFPFPSISEQQKIASFLSGIDTKIESVAAQIERTKGYKKGLLQKMFV